MIAFVPVTRYRIVYVVGAGRPYSAFERFLLEAIGDGISTIDDLVQTFKIHRRIIVEGIVSLLHARWIGLAADSGGARFLVTRSGHAALSDKASLPPRQRNSTHYRSLMMEHVAGQITRSAVTLRTKRDLKELGLWELGIPIRSRIRSDVLEPGQVRPFLSVRADANEYIRWIEHIEPAGTTAFVLTEVNMSNGMIKPGSIPREWEALLAPRLVDEVQRVDNRRRETSGRLDDQPLKQFLMETSPVADDPGNSEETWPVQLERQDLVIGAKAHLAIVKDRLARAQTMVVLSSAYLHFECVQFLAPHFKAAINRGICVDVLWGKLPAIKNRKSHNGALQLLRVLENETQASGGRLLVVDEPCNSNARILLSDPLGVFEAVVGSHDWLSEPPTSTRKTASVRLSHPGPVGRLCLMLADVVAYDERLSTSASVVGLRNAAAMLDRRVTSETHEGDRINEIRVGLICDQYHQSALHTALSTSVDIVTISSELCDEKPLRHAINLCKQQSRSGDSRIEMVLGADAGQELSVEELHELEECGMCITQQKDLATNTLVMNDDYAIVTSCAWLTEAMCPHRPSAFEVGVVLEGDGIAEIVSNPWR